MINDIIFALWTLGIWIISPVVYNYYKPIDFYYISCNKDTGGMWITENELKHRGFQCRNSKQILYLETDPYTLKKLRK